MIKSLFKLAVIAIALVFLIFLTWANVRLYSVPRGAATLGEISADALPQLTSIGRRLRAGEGADMQRMFPEGWFFSHALYGYAWVNVGLQTQDADLKQRAVAEVRWVLAQLHSPEGVEPFLTPTQVEHGVFYLGWSNRLLGGLLAMLPETQRTAAEVADFHRNSDQLATAFRTTGTRHLDAYPGQAWPCDNVMALASLRLHDDLFGAAYGDVIEAWLTFTQQHLDAATGLIVHRIDGSTGRMLTAARASTQVYILSLLPELSPAFARAQYAQFRRLYVQDWFIWLPVREYPKGTSGKGDVDTGPLVFGVSPSGTTVSIAAARANGDLELAERSIILSETFGLPWTSGGEKSFAFGRIIVADAFLVWGKTLVPWSRTPAATFAPTTPTWWRWRCHGVSALVFASLAFGLRKLNRR